ncbi:hypothetical protein Bbelb_444850 [Branchiostoma belcheri]|nr:hypothetical protein Bbelb_444850 [Branchiostoma belcheri]
MIGGFPGRNPSRTAFQETGLGDVIERNDDVIAVITGSVMVKMIGLLVATIAASTNGTWKLTLPWASFTASGGTTSAFGRDTLGGGAPASRSGEHVITVRPLGRASLTSYRSFVVFVISDNICDLFPKIQISPQYWYVLGGHIVHTDNARQFTRLFTAGRSREVLTPASSNNNGYRVSSVRESNVAAKNKLRELNIRAQALMVNHSAANDLPKKRRHPKKRRKKKAAKDKGKEEKEEEEDEQDTYRYYTEIAEKFPNMKLSTILDAEKKFVAADEDGNGTIDEDELEKILDTENTMFTKDQVKSIMKEVDSDETGNLDFLECLAVMDRLQSHRKTNLPSSLQNNKSNVCVVQ